MKKRLIMSCLLSTTLLTNIAPMVVSANETNESTEQVTTNVTQDNSWEAAKKAGFSREQYESIINMPHQEACDPNVRLREAMTAQQKAVVDEAKKYLGVPYVWGGTTPAGFDCSGLTQYVYKKAVGKDIGRVTTEQETKGKEVSLNSLKPGDLLFFGPRGNTYHVAIYIGDGKMIQAPEPNDVVKVTELKYYMPDFARRILPESDPKPIACDQYVTVTKKGTNLYTDTSLSKVKQSSDKFYQKTLYTNKYVTDSQNKKYYAIYDNTNTFQGYLSESALKVSDHAEGGIFFSDDYYAKITQSGKQIWKDLHFNNAIDSTDNHMNTLYHVKGHYNHFNGEVYLTLYNGKDEWCGYINQKFVTKSDSVLNDHHSYKKYETVVKKGVNIYQDKLLKTPVATTDNYLNQTVFARGYYDAFDGKRYMSIFEEDKTATDGLKWIGYVDESALKLALDSGNCQGGIAFAQPENTLVSVTKAYTIWDDLNFQTQIGKAKEGTWYEIQNKYHHFNKFWYASIYQVDRSNGKRTFAGYMNTESLNVENNNFGEYHSFGKQGTIKKTTTVYGLYKDKNFKNKVNTSDKLVGKTFTLKGYYDRLPYKDGSHNGRYYSLYDANGEWQGYMISSAFDVK